MLENDFEIFKELAVKISKVLSENQQADTWTKENIESLPRLIEFYTGLFHACFKAEHKKLDNKIKSYHSDQQTKPSLDEI